MADKIDRSRARISDDVPMHDMTDEPGIWSDVDRLFFEENPERTHYIRKPLAGELEAMLRRSGETPPDVTEGFIVNVVIKRPNLEHLVKTMVWAKRELPNDEDTARAFFDTSVGPGIVWIYPSQFDA